MPKPRLPRPILAAPFRRLRLGAAIIGAAIIASAVAAGADAGAGMEFRLVEDPLARALSIGYSQEVYAEGEITPGTAERLRHFLDEKKVLPDALVHLDSPGGKVVEAMAVGRLLRERQLRTTVGAWAPPKGRGGKSRTRPGICLSACALAYLGGRFRFLPDESLYGVHRFRFADGREGGADIAQLLDGVIVSYVAEMGVAPDFFRETTRAGSDDMHFPPPRRLRELRVVTGDIAEFDWRLEARQGHVYLRGRVLDVHGEHKLLFVCDGGGTAGVALVDAGDQVDMVKSSVGHLSLILDGEFLEIDRQGANSVSFDQRYATVTFRVPEKHLPRLRRAEEVGFAIVAASRVYYVGFRIPFGSGRRLFSDYVAGCQPGR